MPSLRGLDAQDCITREKDPPTLMAITTSIAPIHAWRMLGMALLCAVFGAWGAYDYWQKIPRQEENFARFEAAKATQARIEDQRATLRPGQSLSPEDDRAFRDADDTIRELAPAGKPPIKPSKFNRMTQW